MARDNKPRNLGRPGWVPDIGTQNSKLSFGNFAPGDLGPVLILVQCVRALKRTRGPKFESLFFHKSKVEGMFHFRMILFSMTPTLGAQRAWECSKDSAFTGLLELSIFS